MRALVVQMGVTLDGFVHGAQGYEEWGLPPEEDDVVAWKTASLREAGTHIMGRVSYEAMAQVWPTGTGVYADGMNDIPSTLRLDLVNARAFPSGTAIHTYQPLEET